MKMGEMGMRNLIDLLESSNYVTTVNPQWSNNKIEIFRNPTLNDVKKMGGLVRAFVARNGDLLYFSDNALHSEIENQLDVLPPHLLLSGNRRIAWNELEGYRLVDEEPDYNIVKQYYHQSLADQWKIVRTNPNVLRYAGCDASIKIDGQDEWWEVTMTDKWIADYATGTGEFE
jgi:hypothetical protein